MELLVRVRLIALVPGGVLGDGEVSVREFVVEHRQSGAVLSPLVSHDGFDLSGAAAVGAGLIVDQSRTAAGLAFVLLGNELDGDVVLREGQCAVIVVTDNDLIAPKGIVIDHGGIGAGDLTGHIEVGLAGIGLGKAQSLPDDLGILVVLLGLEDVALAVQQLEGKFAVLHRSAVQRFPCPELDGAGGVVLVGKFQGIDLIVLAVIAHDLAVHRAVALVVGGDLHTVDRTVVGIAGPLFIHLCYIIGIGLAVIGLGIAEVSELDIAVCLVVGCGELLMVLVLNAELELIAGHGMADKRFVGGELGSAPGAVCVGQLRLAGLVGADDAGSIDAAGQLKARSGHLCHPVADAGWNVLHGHGLAVFQRQLAAVAHSAGPAVRGLVAVSVDHALTVGGGHLEDNGEVLLQRRIGAVDHRLGDDQIAVGIVAVGDLIALFAVCGDVIRHHILFHGVDDLMPPVILVQSGKGCGPLPLIIGADGQHPAGKDRLIGDNVIGIETKGNVLRTSPIPHVVVILPDLGDRVLGLDQVVAVD